MKLIIFTFLELHSYNPFIFLRVYSKGLNNDPHYLQDKIKGV